MGFDLYGTRPRNKKGDYFRNNVWWWRALADFVLQRCEHMMKQHEMRFWGSNDGQKVGKKSAEAIAKELQRLIKNGTVKAYTKQYMKDLKAIPDTECDICHGTGIREFKEELINCNGCNGKGTVRPWQCHYPFSEANVKEFAKFCQNSGGFRIC